MRVETVPSLLIPLASALCLAACSAPQLDSAEQQSGERCTDDVQLAPGQEFRPPTADASILWARFTVTHVNGQTYSARSASRRANASLTIPGVGAAEAGGEPALAVASFESSAREFIVRNEESADSGKNITGRFCFQAYEPVGTPDVFAAARANLDRVGAEIDDSQHLAKYRFDGVSRTDRFLVALFMEYESQPAVLDSRLKALSSMIFFEAPEIGAPEGGNPTPFHGMTTADFSRLITMHTAIWEYHKRVNGGSKVGVRPFSVCEQSFMIDNYAKPCSAVDECRQEADSCVAEATASCGGDATCLAERGCGELSWPRFPTLSAHGLSDASYHTYVDRFDAWARGHCDARDFTEWFNFRGLGHLRPTWIESNIMERAVRKMVGECDRGRTFAGDQDACDAWHADRGAYRYSVNQQLSSRFMFYAPEDEIWFEGTGNATVLLPDQDGDGIGEFIRPRPSEWIATPATLARDKGTFDTRDALDEYGWFSLLERLFGFADTTPNDGNYYSFDWDTFVRTRYPNDPAVTGTSTEIGLPYEDLERLKRDYLTRMSEAAAIEQMFPEIEYSAGDQVIISVVSTGEFSGEIHTSTVQDMVLPGEFATESLRPGLEAQGFILGEGGGLAAGEVIVPGGSSGVRLNPEDIAAERRRDPGFDPAWWSLPDFGLLSLFSAANPLGAGSGGCNALYPTPDECPLLKRFYVMVDRHESFYNTYSALHPDFYSISKQPSPLVASSVTIGESNAPWSCSGVPEGGQAGFIFLMRLPFDQVLTGSPSNLSTLSDLPYVAELFGNLWENEAERVPSASHPTRTLNMRDIYSGTPLDMGKVWIDIASLSNDLYAGENEISKYGAVPADQIISIIVVREPTNMLAPGEEISDYCNTAPEVEPSEITPSEEGGGYGGGYGDADPECVGKQPGDGCGVDPTFCYCNDDLTCGCG